MCTFRRAHSTHLLRVFTDLGNDDWWEVDLFAVKLVGTNWAFLDELRSERLELLHEELGHVLDILDVSDMSILMTYDWCTHSKLPDTLPKSATTLDNQAI